jgi:hypothetical protein
MSDQETSFTAAVDRALLEIDRKRRGAIQMSGNTKSAIAGWKGVKNGLVNRTHHIIALTFGAARSYTVLIIQNHRIIVETAGTLHYAVPHKAHAQKRMHVQNWSTARDA